MCVKEFVYTNPYRESIIDYSTQADNAMENEK